MWGYAGGHLGGPPSARGCRSGWVRRRTGDVALVGSAVGQGTSLWRTRSSNAYRRPRLDLGRGTARPAVRPPPRRPLSAGSVGGGNRVLPLSSGRKTPG